MKQILILFLINFNLVFSQKASSFEGAWCNSDLWQETGEIFQIEITSEGNKISVKYYNGGPFEEFYTGKITKKETLSLFFDSIEGTISFNKVNDIEKTNSKSECKKIKFAECKMLSKEKLQITTFKNKCSLMPYNKTIILEKHEGNDTCIPNN